MDQYPDISPEVLERIERYLTGQMELAGIAAFEADLLAQPLLRAQTEEVRLLITGIREFSVAEKLNGFHEGLAAGSNGAVHPASAATAKIEKPVPKIGTLKRWLVAASVIVVVGIGAFLALDGGSQRKDLFAVYYEKDPGLLSAMGSTSDNYDFDRAMIDYKKGANAAAIKTWEQLLKKSPANDTLQYFLGSAWLAEGKASTALDYFTKVIGHGPGSFLSEAYWYAGLALLKEGKKEEAMAMIRKSTRPEKEELLEKLK